MGKSVSDKNTAIVKNDSDLSQKLFMGTMLGMSWQMAVAVLLPTVVGYKLDDHFKSGPLLTIIGLVLAVVSSVLIIRGALKSLNTYMMPPDPTTKPISTKR